MFSFWGGVGEWGGGGMTMGEIEGQSLGRKGLEGLFGHFPHQRFLKKLDHFGIRGKVNCWITLFLIGCSQREITEGATL